MRLGSQDDPCPIFRVSQASCWRRCLHFTQACSLGWGWGGSGGHRVGLGVAFSLYRGPGPLAEGRVQGRGPPEELALCHVVGSHGRRPSPTLLAISLCSGVWQALWYAGVESFSPSSERFKGALLLNLLEGKREEGGRGRAEQEEGLGTASSLGASHGWWRV